MNRELEIVATPLIAFAVAAGSVLPVRRLARRYGAVANPVPDSRHREPTPYFGGLSIIGATLVAIAVTTGLPLWMALSTVAMLAVGIVDDALVLTPRQKLWANIAVGLGLVIVLPRFGLAPWPIVDAALALFWLVSTTNSFNLIDGLDGLASGIGIIAAIAIAALAILHHDLVLAGWSLALAGALAGFLLYNFHPASIFMGDGGALPVGLLLGVLSLRAAGLATNSRLTIYVFPVLAMLVPLLDTAIVTITRMATGRGISKRGLDHSHHRLLSLGLSDQRAVLVCWIAAAAGAACAVVAGMIPHPYLISTLPLMVLAAATAGLFLMDLSFDSQPPGIAHGHLPRLARFIVRGSYQWRVADVALDGVLICAAWFGAFLIRSDFVIDNQALVAPMQSLPWVIAASYAAFAVSGVYRVMWRYAGLSNVIRFAGAAAIAAVMLLGLSKIGPLAVDGSTALLFAILAFNLLVASRMSFRILRAGIGRLALPDERVLIIGTGELGETAARSLLHDRSRLQLVGFVDDDGFKRGKLIEGLNVLGSLDDLERIHSATAFNQILIADDSLDESQLSLLWSFANEWDLSFGRFSIEVSDLGLGEERNGSGRTRTSRQELRRSRTAASDPDLRPSYPRASHG